jgi:F-type H+-transporting ATPase subunit delta
MMMQMSKEYAEALFALAMENDKQNEYALSLECIQEILLDNPEYIDFLSSPGITLATRLDAIEKAFGDSIEQNVVSFVKLLCEKGRIRAIKSCIEEYKKLLNAEKSISTAIVTSAIELTEEEKQRLTDKLEVKSGHSVILECKIDKSLIGGLVIELDGKMIDASVKGRLGEVKDVISK